MPLAPCRIMANQRQTPLTNAATEVDDTSVQRILLRIVIKMEPNPSSREDLMQEGMVHFWLESERNPGHSLSWYLQSCKFHLQHRRVAGRSLDSPKRSLAQTSVGIGSEDSNELFETVERDGGVLSEVS